MGGALIWEAFSAALTWEVISCRFTGLGGPIYGPHIPHRGRPRGRLRRPPHAVGPGRGEGHGGHGGQRDDSPLGGRAL